MKGKGKKAIEIGRCPKCECERWIREDLAMYGRYGIMGRGYRFLVFICEDCGYSQLFYSERSAWI